MKRQKGLTLTGMIITSTIAIVLLLLAAKIVPVYIEYFAIKNQMKALALDPKMRGASRGAINNAWGARATIDDLHSISPDAIEVEKDGDGLLVSGQYSKKVPLFKNVSACFDFSPSSK
jgi:Tfp pilus assembly major pilin PilA